MQTLFQIDSIMGKKNVYYKYNPETDNFERFYPSFKTRLLSFGKTLAAGCVIAAIIIFLFFCWFDAPTEVNLRSENSDLRSQYNILERRLDNSLKVMEDIQHRDDNFYRVMMQLDPVSRSQRLAGLDNEARYSKLRGLNDASLIERLTRQMDLLDRQLYAQSLSFDELRASAANQKDKLIHIPSILPIDIKDYTMSSGYGYRRDPVYGSTKFHAGLDFAAHEGTPVYATADGVVDVAERKGGYGNCIDIVHGYNYMTRFGHLSQILVSKGDKVHRGQLIGKVGSTGKSTGPHLHYEVRFKGEPQNPVNYYFLDLTPEQYHEMIRLADDAANVMD